MTHRIGQAQWDATGVVVRAQHPQRDCYLAMAASVVVAGIVAGAPGSGTASHRLLGFAVGLVPGMLSAVAVLRRRPRSCTPADRVTLARAALAGGCAAMTVQTLLDDRPSRSWAFLLLAAATLLLDAVDGPVARRTNTATAAGARFDMEVDAGVLVVLSFAAAPIVGWWVLAIGAMRYLLLAATYVWPVLATPLPKSQFRRTVAAIQATVLATVIAPLFPVGLVTGLAAGALALLVASFASQLAEISRLRS